MTLEGVATCGADDPRKDARCTSPTATSAPSSRSGMGVATVPTVAVATRKVQDVLSNRTIPLLAIFSAISFTIMMFNIPVPGGTTAHGVGGTLIAIVLGPWAAVIGVSVALIIQALFFGDGGVLAIFANCFNMAIVHAVRRLRRRTGCSPDGRRSCRAGAPGRRGSRPTSAITVSALAVGIELGIQPHAVHRERARRCTARTACREAVPAMLLAHVFGASVVEGVITVPRHRLPPEAPPGVPDPAADRVRDGRRARGPGRAGGRCGSWSARRSSGPSCCSRSSGWRSGGGDPGHAVRRRLVERRLGRRRLDAAGRRRDLAAILVPLAWLVLPPAPQARGHGVRRGGRARAARADRARLRVRRGIARRTSRPPSATSPGAAGPVVDVQRAARRLQPAAAVLRRRQRAAVARRDRLRDRRDRRHPAVRRRDLRPRLADPAVRRRRRDRRRARRRRHVDRGGADTTTATAHDHEGHVGWLEHTVAGISGSIERAVFTEEHARSAGWLQGLDPRAKLGMFLAVVLAASLSSSILVLVALYAVDPRRRGGEPHPVRLLRQAGLARHPALRRDRRHPGDLLRARPAPVRARRSGRSRSRPRSRA